MDTFYKVVRMEREGEICFRCTLLQKKNSTVLLYRREMMKETCLNRDPMIIVEKKISTSYNLDVYTSSYIT